MTEAEILTWIGTLWPGPLMRGSDWLFGFAEVIHFMGLCLLFGALIIIDVRLLGFFRWIPAKSVLIFTRYAIVGFLLMAASGWLFFTTTPAVYWGNAGFKLKMTLVLLAGLNALVFTMVEHRRVVTLGPSEDTPPLTKITAILSLTLWVAVLVLGRLLPTFTVSQN